MTYFRRYRMEMDLRGLVPTWNVPELESRGYEWVAFDERTIREHAAAKFQSFRTEMDADVFPCLGRRDGCLRLMREIAGRIQFVPGATWLLRHRDRPGGRPTPVGTIQGLDLDEWGAIQNLGVTPEHRGGGLGRLLLLRAAAGFQAAGLKRMHLEVTTANTRAVNLYERIGFQRKSVVYKACEVAGV